MSGFPVHHQFPELAQTHIHQVGDAIQPSYPLSSPSPPAVSLGPSGLGAVIASISHFGETGSGRLHHFPRGSVQCKWQSWSQAEV